MNDRRALIIMYSCILDVATIAMCCAVMPQDTGLAVDSVVFAAIVAAVCVMLVRKTAGAMPSSDETFPPSMSSAGQRGSLATARKLTELVNFEPDPQNTTQITNRSGGVDGPVNAQPSKAYPSDNLPRSALSAPDNFVAEKGIRSIYRRYIGRRRWPIVLIGSMTVASAAAYTMLRGSQPLSLRFLPSQRAALQMSTSADPGSTASREPAGQSTIQKPADRTPSPQPPHRSEVQDGAPAFQERLATSGLPASSSEAVGPSDVRVTAFPLVVAPEPIQPEEQARPVAPDKANGARKPVGDARKLDALVTRGQQLLAAGEVASARRFFQRVASEGDPRGARGMARSYDERILRKLPVVGTEANAAEAKSWYEKAEKLEAALQAGERGITNDR